MSSNPSLAPRRKALAVALVAALASSTTISVLPGAAFAEPQGGYAPLVKKVAPSVVFIEVTESAPKAQNGDDQSQQDSPFQQFSQQFSQHFGMRMPGAQGDGKDQNAPQGHGVGCGFIIESKGLIVTNNHVVDGASAVKVTLTDGRTFDAKVVGTDPVSDVALIKVDSANALPAVGFGSSNDIQVGDDVMAVGNPFGLSSTVTRGVISAKARDIGSGVYDNYLQTDAAINKGNSGGPLLNDAGQVVGMNTAILSPSGGSIGIGFAVPSDEVQKIVAQLENGSKVEHGWLGVQIEAVTPDMAVALGMDKPEGAMVSAVTPDSPAAKAGIKRGDIITQFGDASIHVLHDLPRAVAMTMPDTNSPVEVLRAGKKVDLNVQIGTMAPQNA